MKKIVFIVLCLFLMLVPIKAVVIEKQMASVTMLCNNKTYNSPEAHIIILAWEDEGFAYCLPVGDIEAPCYLRDFINGISTPNTDPLWSRFANTFGRADIATTIATALTNGDTEFYNFILRKASVDNLTLSNIGQFHENFNGKKINYSRSGNKISIEHSGYGVVTGTCSYTGYNIGTYKITLPSDEPEPVPNPSSPGKPNDKYSGVETCSDVDIKRIKACGCIPAEIADITSKIYFILRIVGPVLLLILGGFDMAKAIATQDESAIEKAKKKLINKFIAAAAIFLVLTVIEFVVGLLAKDATSTMKCIDILLKGYFI